MTAVGSDTAGRENVGADATSVDAGAGRVAPAPPAPPVSTDALRRRYRRVQPGRGPGCGRELADLIGGPMGRHSALGRVAFLTASTVLLGLAALTLVGGFLAKAPCLRTNEAGTDLDWSGYRQYVSGCYNDTVVLYGIEGLAGGHFPYKYSWRTDEGMRYMEYPVLTGLYQYGSMAFAKAWHAIGDLGLAPQTLEAVQYFVVTSTGLALAWLVALALTTRLARDRVWDVALMAASPLVVVHVFTNFDALAILAMVAALYAWARGRPVWSGVAIGIGVSLKLFPVFLLGPLLVLCFRARRMYEWLQVLVAALASWLLVNLPIMLLYPNGWAEFFRMSGERGAEMNSIYAIIETLTGYTGFQPVDGLAPPLLNSLSLGLFVLACLAIAWLGLTAPVAPRLASLSFLVVAAFLLTNKVWSPQFSLWLVPLAVLAVPRTRLLLTWMFVEAVVWYMTMWRFLGPANRGIEPEMHASVALLRDVILLAVIAVVVHEILHPEADAVRRAHDGRDPLAGPCGHAHGPERWSPGVPARVPSRAPETTPAGPDLGG